jgi:replicative DNA helicase
MQDISALKFSISDKRGQSISDVSATARRIAAKNGADIIFVDHLQLLTSGRRREENRTNELDYISWGLKNLAGELKVPVVVPSQLSRAVEARNDKRPQLSDLRDSGAIEQNADIVMTLYRDRYYNDKADNTVEIAVKKNRNGRLGTVRLKFSPEYSRFEEMNFGGQYVGEVAND